MIGHPAPREKHTLVVANKFLRGINDGGVINLESFFFRQEKKSGLVEIAHDPRFVPDAQKEANLQNDVAGDFQIGLESLERDTIGARGGVWGHADSLLDQFEGYLEDLTGVYFTIVVVEILVQCLRPAAPYIGSTPQFAVVILNDGTNQGGIC